MSHKKPSVAERERVPHNIRWGDQDWADITASAEVLSAREFDTITPTAVIRRAVRRFVADLLRKK